MRPGGSTVRSHWDGVWTDKEADEVSWFEVSPRTSVDMIESLSLSPRAPIIDVGGGASGLAGELLSRGYEDLTVADISDAALEKARDRLGRGAQRIQWVVADARAHDFGRSFALWHDRAVFHFLVHEEDRDGYMQTLRRSLAPNGNAIIATFGPNGPTSCSGLPTVRYSADELARVLSPIADLVSNRIETHETPSGSKQQFLYAHLRVR